MWREMNFTATPAGALQPLRRRARRDAAGQDSYLVRAAGAGSAVHRAADRRYCPFVADTRRSCAADGGTVARHPPILSCALIEVPKILPEDVSMRTAVRETPNILLAQSKFHVLSGIVKIGLLGTPRIAEFARQCKK